MGFPTKNSSNYFNVKIVREPKFFEKNGDKPAATFLTFAHNSDDDNATVFVDAKVMRGAKLAANLRKGDIVNLWGQLTFKVDKNGDLRGVLNSAEVDTLVRLKDRGTDSIPEMAEPTPEAGAPAFE